MKNSIYILLILVLATIEGKGQEIIDLNLKDLKRVNCEGVNETASNRKQMQCLMVDVVLDSVNHYPSLSRKSDSIISTPEEAWSELKKVYSEIPQDKFVCWTEYAGYYCFAFDCGLSRKKGLCSFVCMIYINKGENEFWFYVLRT